MPWRIQIGISFFLILAAMFLMVGQVAVDLWDKFMIKTHEDAECKTLDEGSV